MITKPTHALTLLLLLGFIWGTGYSIARFATTHGVPPLGYSFWQALGPALFLCFFKKSSLVSYKITMPKLKFYLMCGLVGIVIPNTNMYYAAAHLPAGVLAVIVNTVPIFAYILSIMARVEAFNPTRFCGVIAALLGLMFILLPNNASLPSQEMAPWVLIALITPLSFAFFAVFIAQYRPKEEDSNSLATGMLIAASFLLSPLVFSTHNFYMFHFPLQIQDGIILLEIILSSVGYILFFQLIKTAGPVYYSLVDTIVALTGLFWGYVIFHEKLNAWTTPAVILILFALILVTKEQRHLLTTRENIC